MVLVPIETGSDVGDKSILVVGKQSNTLGTEIQELYSVISVSATLSGPPSTLSPIDGYH